MKEVYRYAYHYAGRPVGEGRLRGGAAQRGCGPASRPSSSPLAPRAPALADGVGRGGLLPPLPGAGGGEGGPRLRRGAPGGGGRGPGEPGEGEPGLPLPRPLPRPPLPLSRPPGPRPPSPGRWSASPCPGAGSTWSASPTWRWRGGRGGSTACAPAFPWSRWRKGAWCAWPSRWAGTSLRRSSWRRKAPEAVSRAGIGIVGA